MLNCNFCNKTHIEKLSFKNLFLKNKKFFLCEDCKKQLTIKELMRDDFHLFYFANYNFLKEIIYKIKYLGDIRVCKKFEPLFKNFFSIYQFDVITIVPSNITRQIIRGYNHLEIICTLCNINYLELLYCDYRPKQSKLHTKRHEHTFYLLENLKLDKSIKTILIIDDIFTSGNTLISCKKTLEQHFPKSKIFFLTLALSQNGKL